MADAVSKCLESPELAGPDLENPSLYINRELSWLSFNRRVMALARDPDIPLLERLRFLCITSSNLDEFFEVRVAGLIQQAKYGSAKSGPEQMSAAEVLDRIDKVTHELVAEQYRVLNEEMFPSLEAAGIRFLRRGQWTDAQGEWIRRYFEEQLLPIVSPIRLDPAHPFPRVQNKSLHFIVSISGEDAFGQAGGMAVVQAPRPLPRLIRLPEEVSGRPHDFVFLSSIIHAHVADLFPGMEVMDCYQFRVTRNSDLFVDPEEVDDLMRALQGELPSRHYGEGVRLEVADNCPEEIIAFLLQHFHLEPHEVYRVNGPVNLHRLMTLPDLVDRSDLKYPGFTPGLPAGLAPESNMFDAISQGDILLHHPFQSFAPVVDFVRQAAADANVLAIKQTLYRTGSESLLVGALVNAARAGKEVTVVVELRARFDEEANISLAANLQEAGAHVVYGVVGYKTHAKMLMVVRREGGRLKRYIHLGTGNYHARTARIYTDYGLFTTDPEIGADVHRVFMQLTSLGTATELGRILQAPFSLHTGIIDYIEREARLAREGKPGCIIAKLNGLIDPVVIKALYEASRAGVSIDLIVRGICGLLPGVPGVSENIRVRSVVGRFLEHTRIYYFGNDGKPALYLASADWMPRNLYQRVETGFPVLKAALSRQIISQGLMHYLADNCQAWELRNDGEYHRLSPAPDEPRFSAQEQLLAELAAPSSSTPPALKTATQAPAYAPKVDHGHDSPFRRHADPGRCS